MNAFALILRDGIVYLAEIVSLDKIKNKVVHYYEDKFEQEGIVPLIARQDRVYIKAKEPEKYFNYGTVHGKWKKRLNHKVIYAKKVYTITAKTKMSSEEIFQKAKEILENAKPEEILEKLKEEFYVEEVRE